MHKFEMFIPREKSELQSKDASRIQKEQPKRREQTKKGVMGGNCKSLVGKEAYKPLTGQKENL